MKIRDILEDSLSYTIKKIKSALEDERYEPNEKHLKIMVEKAQDERIDPVLVAALVAKESSFEEDAKNRNRDGSSDYGYFQLNDEWHDQHKYNPEKHIEAGIEHLKWCLSTENNDEDDALARYNAGTPDSTAGQRYARRIQRFRRKIGRKVR